jgi:hypothetical protein
MYCIYMNMNIELVPYKNNNKSHIEKYHISNSDNLILKYKICNVFAPFGRQYLHQTKEKINQHRLNVCFSKKEVEEYNESYEELKKIISELETFFYDFDELKGYELISNIIDRDSYGKVIRFHLKTLKNNTTSSLIQIIDSVSQKVEWIQFQQDKQFNFDFSPDCFWIDHTNKKYGVSLVIINAFQFIS